MEPLIQSFQSHRNPSPQGAQFIQDLENTIAQDLWGSVGGHWSEKSMSFFRLEAMKELAREVQGDTKLHYQEAWTHVVRDFHRNQWNEQRLARKEKKAKTQEQKIFWELFSYIWVLCQAVFVTKTAIFYFGIKSAQEEGTLEGKIYVTLALLFSFGSLWFFAIRKSRPKDDDDK